MLRFYLVPIEVVGVPGNDKRGPEYFVWKYDSNPPSIDCRWSLMDYGFIPSGLVLADISQADHDALVLNSDVYSFPTDLLAPVSDPSIDAFFEGINIPTDWLTPSTSYLELLRQTAGMFQFNQRYGEISGGRSVFDTATLDTRLRQMAADEQAFFLATVDSFGFPSGSVNLNSTLRQLVKQAGSFWDGVPFWMGGYSF